MEKYLVSLDDAERAALLDVTRKGKAAARRIAHARILLLAGEGRPDDEIAATVAVGTRTVSRVRKRLVTEGLDAALDPRPQPPRPGKLKIRRTRLDYAECVKELVDVHYPQAEKILLVQDNLNTHSGGSLYERFVPQEALRLLDRVEFHYTPKHGSWLNMAETEIGIMGKQCLDRRLDCQTKLASEVAAWENKRNERKARIHWTFTLAVARQKLRKLYPSIEG
jgi:hypothetical protein